MTDKEIDTLLQLSQIDMTSAERKEFSASIDQMVEYFAIMGEFTDPEEASVLRAGTPHTGVPHAGTPHTGVPRAGTPHTGVPLSTQPEQREPVAPWLHTSVEHAPLHDYTTQAPESESGFFVVPHVI